MTTTINLPYMATPGTLPKILNKIIEASVPESFNSDFLGTKLGFSGGSPRTFISWAKKCGFLNTDGTPTQIYRNFRNPGYRGIAMAEALRIGYSEMFTRNVYAQELSRADLIKLISDITGLAHDNSTVKVIASSFINAKEYADFESKQENVNDDEVKDDNVGVKNNDIVETGQNKQKLNLGLSYTINLVLPKTDDPAIYKAIFKSLKENLLDE